MRWSRYFRRAQRSQESAQELNLYLETEIEDNLARGMSPEDARAAARRKLGNPTLIREEIYRLSTIAVTRDRLAGSALCPARDAQEPYLYADGRTHVGSGNRRQHRHVQRHPRRFAQAARLS